jgi:hypothetical protein
MMARIFFCFSICLSWVLYGVSAYAGEPLKPPKCVGRICLEQRIERYRNVIKATYEHDAGPIAFLNDDEGYVSAKSAGTEESNWVQATFCESPGLIKAIHRTTIEDKGADYAMVLEAFEKRYGKADDHISAGGIYEFKHSWKWDNPPTTFSLAKIRGSKYLSIELHDLSLERKDAQCAGRREAPALQTAGASSSAGFAGPIGGASPGIQDPQTELGHNMDQGLSVREVYYIMSMQDTLQAVRDMIQIQEGLMGDVTPAKKESMRQELKRIQEKTRKIVLDFRSVFTGRPMRN